MKSIFLVTAITCVFSTLQANENFQDTIRSHNRNKTDVNSTNPDRRSDKPYPKPSTEYERQDTNRTHYQHHQNVPPQKNKNNTVNPNTRTQSNTTIEQDKTKTEKYNNEVERTVPKDASGKDSNKIGSTPKTNW